MDVEDGEVVIIKGESGSGYASSFRVTFRVTLLGMLMSGNSKTSLLKCMAELSVYQAGEILLHGKYVTTTLFTRISER